MVCVRLKGNEKFWKKVLVEGLVDICLYNIRIEDGWEYCWNRWYLRISREYFVRELFLLLKIESNLEIYLNIGLLRVIELGFENLRIINYDFVMMFFVKFNRFVDELDIVFNKFLFIY